LIMLTACCLGQACSCCAGQTIRAFGHVIPVNYPRVMHIIIFGTTALISWLCGMYLPTDVLAQSDMFGSCAVSGRSVFDIRSCYVSLFVVRAMAALAVWYGILSLFTINIRDTDDWRVRIYAELWGPKVIALIVLIIIAFILPNNEMVVYNWIALIGAAFFIIIQIIILIDFACEWANSWVTKMEEDAEEYADGCGAEGCNNFYFIALMSTSSAMFLGALGIIIALYVLFTQEYVTGGCSAGGLNAFFITFQLIMSIVSAVCSILPSVKERTPDSGLLQSSFVTIYTAYLVSSALISEPNDWKEGCNHWYTDSSTNGSSQHTSSVYSWYQGITGAERFSAFIGAVITVVAVCYSTFRTSSSTDKLVISDDTTADKASVIAKISDEEDGMASPQSATTTTDPSYATTKPRKLPFSFSLFHLAFMLGTMYVQQLLTNWETITIHSTDGKSEEEIYVDSGVGSVWVKIISSWLVFALYLWSLFAPLIFPDRDFGYGISYSF